MDYRKIAEEIYEKVGKKENIVSAAHCSTRLRLVLADNEKCDVKAVEDIDGVKGVFSASGQVQIILGTGVVNKVYDEFLAVSGLTGASKEEATAAAAAKQPWYKQAIKTLGDIFVPIIPAIVASGFLMGIMEALNFMVNNGFVNIDTSSSIFVFANLFGNTAYVFLPILIAFSAAKVFGGNQYLGAVIGMLMIHPDLQNAWTVATEGVKQTQSVWFGLYKIDLVGYQGHVIPVIIAVFVMCFIEKRLHKIVPAMFDLFVTPLVSVFVTGYLTYSIIGPVFVTVENAIIGGVQQLITLPFGVGSFIMGGLYSATVVAGDRCGAAWTLRKDFLAAAGICSQYCTGSCSTGCCPEDKKQQDQIHGSTVCNVLLYGNHRTGDLRCELTFLPSVHLRCGRWRVRCTVRFHRGTWCNRYRCDRYLRTAAVPE